MTTFYGNHEQTIDAKRRLPITAALREFISPERDGSSFSALVWTDGHLRLYPQKYFLQLIRKSLVESTSTAEQESMLNLFQPACTLKPDAQGRVVLPEKLIAEAKLSTEVVLRGRTDRIEVWPLAEWQASDEAIDVAKVNEIAFRAAQQLALEDNRADVQGQQ